ncbi:MAG: hypothetical protein ACFE0Q_00200 [Anaerolineae bacterium]
MIKTLRMILILVLALGFATTAFAQTEIKVGDTVTGEGEGDTVEYTVSLSADVEVEITLESDDFDTYVRVLDADGEEVAFNDDGFSSGFNSRLEFTPDDTSVYTIVVDAFGGPAAVVGEYELNVVLVDGEEASDETDETDESDASSSGDASLAYGDEEEFDVDDEDELILTFDGADGDVVTIVAISEADQSLTISLQDPDGDEIALFDDFAFGAALLVRVPLEADGLYTIEIAERDGAELEDEIEVQLIESEILDLDAGIQTTSLDSEISQDYMIFEAEEDVVYVIYLIFDGDIDSSVEVDVFEEDDDSFFAPVSASFTGFDEGGFLFEATDDGIVRVELEYLAFFDGDIDITIEVSPLD